MPPRCCASSFWGTLIALENESPAASDRLAISLDTLRRVIISKCANSFAKFTGQIAVAVLTTAGSCYLRRLRSCDPCHQTLRWSHAFFGACYCQTWLWQRLCQSAQGCHAECSCLVCALKYAGFVISLTLAHQSLKFGILAQGKTHWAPSLLSRHPSHALHWPVDLVGWIPRRHHLGRPRIDTGKPTLRPSSACRRWRSWPFRWTSRSASTSAPDRFDPENPIFDQFIHLQVDRSTLLGSVP